MVIFQPSHYRILVIDDEEQILNVNQKILEKVGYQVEVTTSSVEALERIKSQPNHYDLVLTDLNLPELSGGKLAMEIMKVRKYMPIVLCTGSYERLSAQNINDWSIQEVLMKPVLKSELLTVVRRTLEQRKT